MSYYDPYATHSMSYHHSPHLATTHGFHALNNSSYHHPGYHQSSYHPGYQQSSYLGYHDPYYTAPSSQFWDDGYFRNRYSSYYDQYPESDYTGHHSGRFPTYLGYLRDRVRNYETEYYPNRSRYSTYNNHYTSPHMRDSYSRGRYHDIDAYPSSRRNLRSSSHYGRNSLYGSTRSLYGSRHGSSRWL